MQTLLPSTLNILENKLKRFKRKRGSAIQKAQDKSKQIVETENALIDYSDDYSYELSSDDSDKRQPEQEEDKIAKRK